MKIKVEKIEFYMINWIQSFVHNALLSSVEHQILETLPL